MGLQFISAGIDAKAFADTTGIIQEQLEAMRRGAISPQDWNGPVPASRPACSRCTTTWANRWPWRWTAGSAGAGGPFPASSKRWTAWELTMWPRWPENAPADDLLPVRRRWG